MTDQVKFMNTYIDITSATLHDYLNQILQCKTQIKVSADTIAALQSEIERIKSEYEKAKNDNTERDAALQKINELETLNRSLQNKTGHLDTALNQISEMKNNIIHRDNEINSLRTIIAQKDNEINSIKNELISSQEKNTSLEKELSGLLSPKKVINRKKTIQNTSNPLLIDDKPELVKTDDF